MTLVWFERKSECPPFQEIEAMSMDVGETLTVKLCQVAHDAEESAKFSDWYKIRTEIEVTHVAWSDLLATGVYVISRVRGHYMTFAWDRIAVMVLSAGRIGGNYHEKHAIEIAVKRCEEAKGVSSKDANWITNIG